MANNRLLLKCRRCGDDVPIARLSAGSDVWSSARVTRDEFDAFLEKHTSCGDHEDSLSVELTSENTEQLTLSRDARG